VDELLREAFRATAYLVNLDTVSWATIRIDLPLPTELTAAVGTQPWALLTAWNPQARRRAAADNIAAQQALLAALQDLSDVSVYPAIGVGSSGWSEPSLLVIGADTAVLDPLARLHRQLAYVHGHADGAAVLRELD